MCTGHGRGLIEKEEGCVFLHLMFKFQTRSVSICLHLRLPGATPTASTCGPPARRTEYFGSVRAFSFFLSLSLHPFFYSTTFSAFIFFPFLLLTFRDPLLAFSITVSLLVPLRSVSLTPPSAIFSAFPQYLSDLPFWKLRMSNSRPKFCLRATFFCSLALSLSQRQKSVLWFRPSAGLEQNVYRSFEKKRKMLNWCCCQEL